MQIEMGFLYIGGRLELYRGTEREMSKHAEIFRDVIYFYATVDAG